MWVVLNIYFCFLLLSVAFWALKYRHLTPSLRIAGLTLLVTLLFDGTAAFFLSRNTNNNFLYHFLIPVQFVLLSWMYHKELSGIHTRRIILISIPLFLIIAFFLSFSIQLPKEYNSYARLLKNVLVTCWALFYYFEVFLSLRIRRLDTEPMFWVSSGLLFYSLGNVFVDGLMNYLLAQSDRWAVPIYYVNVFLGILLTITFLVSFLLRNTKTFSTNGDSGGN